MTCGRDPNGGAWHNLWHEPKPGTSLAGRFNYELQAASSSVGMYHLVSWCATTACGLRGRRQLQKEPGRRAVPPMPNHHGAIAVLMHACMPRKQSSVVFVYCHHLDPAGGGFISAVGSAG